MSGLWQQARYACRVLLKSPGVTSVAIISLALGIGANTAIFSLINALILRPLPVPHPENIVALATLSADDQKGSQAFTLPMFQALATDQQVFSGLFAWFGGAIDNFEANGVRFAAALDQVTGDYFSTLGIPQLLGRTITPADVALYSGFSSRVAVLSYRCWQQRYNGDPAVIGKTLRIEDKPYTIVGVMPKSFVGLLIDSPSEVTIPIGSFGTTTFRDPSLHWLDIFGRLKPGITLDQAHAQLTTLWPRVQQATVPPAYQGAARARFFSRRIEIKSAATGMAFMRKRFSRPLSVLMALVALVLLAACVNLASLMLARAAGRQREMGVRLALGAGPWQLIRQLLAESMLLSLVAAALGLTLAVWTSHLLLNTMWTGYTFATLDPILDLRVLAFTAAVTMATALIFGLAPAWRITQTDPATALKRTSRNVQTGAGIFGKLLVSGQVALSLVLVIGAALFVRTLQNLRSADLGFRSHGVLLMNVFPQAGHEKIPDRAAYYHELAERLSRLPGVNAVSYSNAGPATNYNLKQPVSISSSPDTPLQAVQDAVGPGFFHLIGMRVLAGREFDWRDTEKSPRVAIISDSLAKHLFHGVNPLGQKLDAGASPGRKGLEIVGVVNSASLWTPHDRTPMALFLPLLQEPLFQTPMVDILTSGDPAALKELAARTLQSLGHQYSLRTQTLDERAETFLAEERVTAMLSTFFGALALLLASIGLYGLMFHAVAQRTSEIGIRMALGAQRSNVVTLILREMMWLTLVGVGIGLALALMAARLVSGMLFGLSPSDPATIALAIAILLVVAIVAAYFPARHAVRIDPASALRME